MKENYLEKLLSGEYAGATALSNAVKYLSDLEELNVYIVEENGQFYLKGRLPWVTNARRNRFLTIFVAGFADDPSKVMWWLCHQMQRILVVRKT